MSSSSSYTLYYLPLACSLSVHILLAEAGADYKAIPLHRVEGGGLESAEGNFKSQVNPKGSAPALVHNGTLRTEAVVVGRYLASMFPDKLYFPSDGDDMWNALELANYLSTDLHKSHSPLFDGLGHISDVKDFAFQKLDRTYTYLNNLLEGKKYLLGDQISTLDVYLYNVTLWAPKIQFDLSKYSNVLALQKSIAQRPSTQQALKEEGLL